MDNKQVVLFNNLIHQAYECRSFGDFLKLAVVCLHQLVMYDSGVFFCAISRDSSFFKPYIGGDTQDFYKQAPFYGQQAYSDEANDAKPETLVYKAERFKQKPCIAVNEPRKSFLCSQDEYHIACIKAVYHGQFMGEIYLHRNKDKPDFCENDMFILELIQPHISNVFHIIHSLTAVKLLEADKRGLDTTGLCLFDDETNLISGNVAGLEILNNSTIFGSSVLYHLKEIMTDLLSSPHIFRGGAAHRFTVLKTPGGELHADIYTTNKSKNRNHHFLIIMEFTDKDRSVTDYKYKFTNREADIIDEVFQGKSNPKIALSLNLSENTVKTHLQNIFKKAGVSTRTELVYLLMLNRNNS